jgi:hypothetical protein
MSLPGAAFSFLTNAPGVARDELGLLVGDRLERAGEDVALDRRDSRVVRGGAGVRLGELPRFAPEQHRVGVRPRLPHDRLDVLAEMQPVDRPVAGREIPVEAARAAVNHLRIPAPLLY